MHQKIENHGPAVRRMRHLRAFMAAVPGGDPIRIGRRQVITAWVQVTARFPESVPEGPWEPLPAHGTDPVFDRRPLARTDHDG